MDFTKYFLLLISLFVVGISRIANASDPDILSDFILLENQTSACGDFFTYTGMRGIVHKAPKTFTVTKASLAEFPALNGQSVSLAILQFPPGAVNPPHTHPRASELLFLVQGVLEVGFIDTKNVLYTQKLRAGDMFIFPKGLVHYQYNRNHYKQAVAISAFGSATAGTVSLPLSIFGNDIDDIVLSKSLKTDVGIIEKIKAGFPKP
ncbi:germin-like protein 9-3 [Nicotiana tabacum]|uniref:Germin-like protein n=1 Tax=Nicotiana tabacum TaxID=4097 RepID=A0A1S4DAK6_TOBAC|nr:germin-like protein 9-3 [Nicotiana tomentosiformis]XP_016510475.1 PREDICTED: germin-like protein 9-3 [Nicotiana tabacum]